MNEGVGATAPTHTVGTAAWGPSYGRLDALDATLGNYVAAEYLQQWRQS
jgi:hypothetical protein